ncbi:unnamed protein product [Sphenostylis stenocarpa]|uniref:Uncharacterized protein n=1 Tax=Sphenostylis stenocarpa TaxID=92480 RepID=A0AA86T897_9FABA|nr:unnamed protein product [Sphenostylis stenocarpa]
MSNVVRNSSMFCEEIIILLKSEHWTIQVDCVDFQESTSDHLKALLGYRYPHTGIPSIYTTPIRTLGFPVIVAAAATINHYATCFPAPTCHSQFPESRVSDNCSSRRHHKKPRAAILNFSCCSNAVLVVAAFLRQ